MQSFLGADKVYYGRCANGEWQVTWLRYDTLFNVVAKNNAEIVCAYKMQSCYVLISFSRGYRQIQG